MRRNEFHLRTRFGLVLILVTALLAAMASLGMAQETTGAITGKITDPSGAAIVGASVTAQDLDRGTVSKGQTNEEGLTTCPGCPSGATSSAWKPPAFKPRFAPRSTSI